MPILFKPFLFLVAFGPLAVLFASVVGLACLLLMTCVRAMAWLPRAATEMLLNAVNSIEQGAPLAASLVIQLIELNSISDVTTIISGHSSKATMISSIHSVEL